jgi:hypothetical protein
MQIFRINNEHAENTLPDHSDDDDDAFIAKIIIIFRSQCEVEICGKFMSKRSFAFSGFQMDVVICTLHTSIYTDEHEKSIADRMQSEIYQKRN